MNFNEFKFSKDHEWIKVEGNTATIGLTDYAQKELGDVVYVELPSVGDTYQKGDACSNIESVKAVSDVFTPISGEVVEVNESLEDSPENVNQSPYENGWILKMKIDDESDLDDLMNKEEYDSYLEELK